MPRAACKSTNSTTSPTTTTPTSSSPATRIPAPACRRHRLAGMDVHPRPASTRSSARQLHTADGGDVVVDNLVGGGNSLRYPSTQNLGSFRRRTFDARQQPRQPRLNPTLTLAGAGPVAQAAPQFKFVTPLAVNDVVANRLIIGGGNGALRIDRQRRQHHRITTGEVNGERGTGSTATPSPTAAAQNGVANNDVLYIGSGSQVLGAHRHDLGAVPATTALPFGAGGAGLITDVEMDPDDWARVFAFDNNQVFFSPTPAPTGTKSPATSPTSTCARWSTSPSRAEMTSCSPAATSASSACSSITRASGPRPASTCPILRVWDMDYDAPEARATTSSCSARSAVGPGRSPTPAWPLGTAPILEICGDENFANQDDTIRLVRNAANPDHARCLPQQQHARSRPPSSRCRHPANQCLCRGRQRHADCGQHQWPHRGPGRHPLRRRQRLPGPVGAGSAASTVSTGADRRRRTRQRHARHRRHQRLRTQHHRRPGQRLDVVQTVDFENLEPITDNVAAVDFAITSDPALATPAPNRQRRSPMKRACCWSAQRPGDGGRV